MRLLTFSIEHSGAAKLGHAGLYTATAWLANMFARAGVKTMEVCFGEGGLDSTEHVTPREAAMLLADGEITAIYTQYIQPGMSLELASMAWPKVVPVISVGHDLVNAFDPILAWVRSPARHSSDVAVISSEAGTRALRLICEVCGSGKLWPEVDIETLPLGTDMPVSDGCEWSATGKTTCSQTEVVYLWIGRFSETYKADLRPLLAAIRHLQCHNPAINPRFVAIGADGSGLVHRLKQDAHALGIGDICTWLPNADNPTRDAWLRRADVFVNVSDHIQETFGLANIEAMAAGLPVIAADWSGFRELVQDGETGLLIPTTLDVDLLTAANLDVYGGFSLATSIDMRILIESMATLGQDPALRIRMGRAARKTVELNYSTECLMPRYLELIERRADMAKHAQPRNAPRNWMPEVFSHYPTGCLSVPDMFVPGPIELETALAMVSSSILKREMRSVLKELGDGQEPLWHPMERGSGLPLKRAAFMLLLKLGVISISGKNPEQGAG